MAADRGGSQISALLESVPGIVNVLRSPVADAIVSMIRAGAGVRPFSYEDAEELVQYAIRRGLIGATEGDDVLEDVKGAKRGGGGRSRSVKTAKHPAARKTVTKKAAKSRNTAKKATVKAARPARKNAAPAKKKVAKKAKKTPARKAAKKPQRGGRRR